MEGMETFMAFFVQASGNAVEEFRKVSEEITRMSKDFLLLFVDLYCLGGLKGDSSSIMMNGWARRSFGS